MMTFNHWSDRICLELLRSPVQNSGRSPPGRRAHRGKRLKIIYNPKCSLVISGAYTRKAPWNEPIFLWFQRLTGVRPGVEPGSSRRTRPNLSESRTASALHGSGISLSGLSGMRVEEGRAAIRIHRKGPAGVGSQGFPSGLGVPRPGKARTPREKAENRLYSKLQPSEFKDLHAPPSEGPGNSLEVSET